MRKNPKGRCKKLCNSLGYFPRRKCDILLTQWDIYREGKLWYPFAMFRSKWASAFFAEAHFSITFSKKYITGKAYIARR